MRQIIASRAYEIERRALVGFGCVFVLLHALLATLAWPLPGVRADAAFAICHAGVSSGVPDPAGDKPSIACALCAHAIATALPPSTTAIGLRKAAYAAIRHVEFTAIRLSAVPVRAGAARAPPG